MSQAEYCPECHKILGVGCNCGETFAERIKSIQINRESLKVRLGTRADKKLRK